MHLYITSGKRLTKNISKRLNTLERSARKVAAAHNEEDIHKLRVAYKKLRALLRMAASAGYATRIPPALKKLYEAAGDIRDLQLHQRAVHAYFQQYNTLPEHYLQHIQHEITEAIISFNKMYKQVSFKRVYKLAFEHLPVKLSRKELINWHSQHVNTIKAMSNSTVTDESIHEIRKHLKDLIYTSAYLSSGETYTEPAELLGAYMDSCVLVTFMNRHKTSAPPEETNMLEYALQTWQADKQAKREQVKGYISKHWAG